LFGDNLNALLGVENDVARRIVLNPKLAVLVGGPRVRNWRAKQAPAARS